MNQPTLNDTLELIKKHHVKLDKTGDIPYFWHLVRVMLRINTTDENVLHIALLHDIVEDTSITLSDLKQMGYNNIIVEGVRWCSRNEFSTLTFIEWMTEFGKNAPSEAVLVKIADISDNLGFERMRGLMTFDSTKKNQKKSVHQYPVQSMIDRKTKKGMRLYGEMGVFDRYYKAWNCIFLNESLLPLITQVKIDDFSNLKNLLELQNWLPKEDFNKYFILNKLNCWQVTGIVEIIQDRPGNDYLALNIDNSLGQLFQDFLKSSIPEEYILNQQNRDSNSFHITLVNVMQYQKLIKSGYEEKIHSLNQFLDNFRNDLKLDKQHYHITLAFKKSDVFINPKDRKSIVFDNHSIWNTITKPLNNKKLKF